MNSTVGILALQSVIKDIIAGFLILFEGDFVKIDKFSGL